MAGRSDISAGRAYVELALQNNLTRPLLAAKQQLQSFGGSAMKVGAGLMGLSAAIAAPLAAATKHFVDFGSALNDMSARTGVATADLAKLGYAAGLGGAGMEDLEKAFISMAKKGIDVHRFGEMADQINSIEDPTLKAAKAMEVWGKSGTKLIPMLDGLADTMAEAEKFGLVPSAADISAADNLGDSWDKLSNIFGAAVFNVGAALAPAMQEIADVTIGIVKNAAKWVRENSQLVRTIATVAAGIGAAGLALTAIGGSAFVLGAALGGIVTIASAVGTVLSTVFSPIGIAVAAVGGLTYAWVRFTESGQKTLSFFSNMVSQAFATIKDSFGGVVDAISGGDLQLAGQIAIGGLRLVFMQGMKAISDLFGGVMGDTIGTLVSQISGGDLTGAFKTVLSGLSDMWAKWSEGVVNMVTSAMRAVTDAWQSTVSGMSDWILQTASKGGLTGNLLSSMLGVDMNSESIRQEMQNHERGKLLQQGRGNAVNALATLQRGGVLSDVDNQRYASTRGGNATIENIQKAIADIDQSLGKSATSFADDASAAAASSIKGMADSFRSQLDAMDESAGASANEAAKEFKNRTAGGNDQLGGDIATLAQQMADLRTQAAAGRGAGGMLDLPRMPGMGSGGAVFGSFSSAAAFAGSGGAGNKIVDTLKANAKADRAQRAELIDAVKNQKGVFAP